MLGLKIALHLHASRRTRPGAGRAPAAVPGAAPATPPGPGPGPRVRPLTIERPAWVFSNAPPSSATSGFLRPVVPNELCFHIKAWQGAAGPVKRRRQFAGGWMKIIFVFTPFQTRVPPPVSPPAPPAHPPKKKITRDFPPIHNVVPNSNPLPSLHVLFDEPRGNQHVW